MKYLLILEKQNSLISVLLNWFLFIGQGVWITLKYSLISIIFGLLISITLTIVNFNKNRFIYKATRAYVSVIRSTPLLLQLSIIYYGLPTLLNIKIDIFLAGVLSFSINSSAYVYEILRSGINSVNKGEVEAAKSLGVKDIDIIRYILIPQAFTNTIPALMGEFINLIKETAIVSILGEEDIMRKANMISSQSYDYLTPLFFAGAWYYFVILVIDFLFKKLTKREPKI